MRSSRMVRVLLALLTLAGILIGQTADAQRVPWRAPGFRPGFSFLPLAAPVPTTFMQVATSVYQPSGVTATGTTSMARKAHIARDSISTIKLGYVTSYRNATTGARVPLGAALPIKAWVEYPAGNYVPVSFMGGSFSPILPDNSLTVSDATALPTAIPANAKFWIWTWANGQAPTTTGSIGILNASAGEGSQTAASGVPTAPSSTVPTGTATLAMPDVLVLAPTAIKSAALFGTSRTLSVVDTTDANSNRGALAKTLCPVMACANYGVAGDSQSSWTQDPVLPQLAQYFTHVASNDPTNNFYVQTGMLVGAQEYDKRWAARFAGKPYIRQTIEDQGTSTDGFVSVANQTQSTQGAAMQAWNAYVRSATDAPYLDVEAGIGADKGDGTRVWAAPGGVAQTDAGLHANPAGTATEVASGSILPSAVTGAPNSAIAWSPTMTSVSASFAGTAAKFGGTGNMNAGSLANYGIMPTTYPFTICFWFKTSYAGGGYLIGNANSGVSISAGAVAAAGMGKAITGTGSYNNGVWHHAALTQTASGSTLYVDGASIGTGAAPTGLNSAAGIAFGVGAQGRATLSGGTKTVVGEYDELTVWNYAMSSTQVATEAAMTSAHTGTESGLVALAHLHDASIIVGPGY